MNLRELLEAVIEAELEQTVTNGTELFITLRAKMNMQNDPLEYSRTCEFDELP